ATLERVGVEGDAGSRRGLAQPGVRHAPRFSARRTTRGAESRQTRSKRSLRSSIRYVRARARGTGARHGRHGRRNRPPGDETALPGSATRPGRPQARSRSVGRRDPGVRPGPSLRLDRRHNGPHGSFSTGRRHAQPSPNSAKGRFFRRADPNQAPGRAHLEVNPSARVAARYNPRFCVASVRAGQVAWRRRIPRSIERMSQDSSLSNSREGLRQAALDYHEFPSPGKLSIAPTRQLTNQRDLSLAYSPGVAAPCEEIVADPLNAYRYTARGNLVAVVTNGTAVLGLGAIGPLAAKPVMEGKAVLFKKFAGVD